MKEKKEKERNHETVGRGSRRQAKKGYLPLINSTCYPLNFTYQIHGSAQI